MSDSDRHSRRRWGWLVATALAGAVPAAVAAPDLMPVPAELNFAPGRLAVAPGFQAIIRGHNDDRLREGLARLLARLGARTGLPLTSAPAAGTAALVVECAGPGLAVPGLDEDESYSLTVDPGKAVLAAPTVVGALRGFATLQQLLQHDAGGWSFPAVSIRDAPRFPWRGLMIDVCRHWQPIEVIERNLDGMALVKLNVLHLHLTDDQGFRIESKKFPRLQECGSDGRFFTQDQMREIIAFAAARGIRVVPEFDLPGHATSWVVGYPELASAPGPYKIERHWGVFNPVLDPTNPRVYELLDGFLGEMAALFPDAYMHLGGDENNGVQWDANPRIQAFLHEHGLKGDAGLQAYFSGRMHAILAKHGKRLVGWDEILQPGLPGDSVIQSWRGADGIVAAALAGHATILSHGYYIDLNHPTGEHYLNDPLPADTPLTPAQQRLVLGGEATMWSEWVSPENIDSRIWPRTAAIAERFWSPRAVRDVPDMYRRLPAVDQRLEEAGLQEGCWPRFDLPGVDPQGAVAGALRTLAAAVEPLPDYQRSGHQPDATQFTPLDELADWSRPDSRVAREFNEAADGWLFGPGALDPKAAAALTAQLESWRAAGELAATAPAAPTPIARARTRTALSLAAVSRAGLEAVASLMAGTPLAADRGAADRTALDEAAQPTAAAVEFPSLPALRLLVAAAGEPAGRNEWPRDAWRRQLQARASPPVAPAGHL